MSKDKELPLPAPSSSKETESSVNTVQNKTDIAKGIMSVLQNLRPEEVAHTLADSPQIASILNQKAGDEQIHTTVSKAPVESNEPKVPLEQTVVQPNVSGKTEGSANANTQQKQEEYDFEKTTQLYVNGIVKQIHDLFDRLTSEQQTKLVADLYVPIKHKVDDHLDQQALIRKQYETAAKFYEQKNFSAAIECIDRALKLAPDQSNYWKLKGDILVWLGEDKKALEAYDRSVELNPNNNYAEMYFKQASLQIKMNLNEQAAESYKKGLKIAPLDKNAWYNLGKIFCRLDRYQEAAQAFEQILKIEPDNFMTIHMKAKALQKSGAYANAIKEYKELLKIYPTMSIAWLGIASCLIQIDSYQEALEAYDQYVKISPNDPNAWTSRSIVLCSLGRYQEFLESCNKALAIKADYQRARDLKIQTFFEIWEGNFSEKNKPTPEQKTVLIQNFLQSFTTEQDAELFFKSIFKVSSLIAMVEAILPTPFAAVLSKYLASISPQTELSPLPYQFKKLFEAKMRPVVESKLENSPQTPAKKRGRKKKDL